MSVAELESKRSALINQIASLTKRVQNGQQGVEYDISFANAAIAIIDADLARARATAGTVRTRTVNVIAVSGI